MIGEKRRPFGSWAMLQEMALAGQIVFWDAWLQALSVTWRSSYEVLLRHLDDLLADGYVEISGDVAMLTKTGLDAAWTWMPF